MSISISCTRCGKLLKIKDEYAGKRIKCPQCSATFTPEEAQNKSREAETRQKKTAAIHLSPGAIVFIALLILIPATFAVWKLGPGRIRDRLEKLQPEAESHITDVVDRALQSPLSTIDLLHSGLAHGAPHTLEVHFPLLNPFPFSMPEKMLFVGTTTQGAMTGHYYIATGEVEADVDIGGAGVAGGGGTARRGNHTIHVTGRMKDGTLTAEVDGKPAIVDWGHKRGE